jgi:hypothetical protein
MVRIKQVLNLIFQRLQILYFSNMNFNISLGSISSVKDKIIYYLGILKTLPLSVKTIIIIVVNLALSFFLYTIIQQLFWFLITVDLFFILSLRPIFFLFSSYFLTVFFSSCLEDLLTFKPTLNLGLFFLCFLLLCITFTNKSYIIRLFSSFTSFIVRIFALGDITVAGGGIKISNTDISTTKAASLVKLYSSEKHPFLGQINEHKQMLVVSSEFPVRDKKSEIFSKVFTKNFINIYENKQIPTINDDLYYLRIRGFTGNTFTTFSEVAEKLNIKELGAEYYDDCYYEKLNNNHKTTDLAILSAQEHLSIAQFNREYLSAKAFMTKAFPDQEYLLRRNRSTDFIATLNEQKHLQFDIANYAAYDFNEFKKEISSKLKKLPLGSKIVLGDFNVNYKVMVDNLPDELKRHVTFVTPKDFQNVLVKHEINYDFLKPIEYQKLGSFSFNEPGKFIISAEKGLNAIKNLK